MITWVTGPTIEQNTRRLQQEIIPAAVEWEQNSGATFEAEKTALIHFTRRLSLEEELGSHQVVMKGQVISPCKSVKLLGVVLDQGLRFQAHAARAAKRGVNAALALKRLKGLPLKATR